MRRNRYGSGLKVWRRGPRHPEYPLRKIVDREHDGNSVYEILECGHRVRQKQDIYGPTNAYRRRCRFCGASSVTSNA